jgi:Tol biopolymer transport system component
MKVKHLWKILMIGLLTLAGTGCSGSAKGHIVYQTNSTGNNEIYIMNTDGTGKKRLTNNTAEDISPTYIKALNKIGFVSNRSGEWLIYTMNLNGSDPTPINESRPDLFSPDWSPDGKSILVASKNTADEKCQFTIGIMNSDGSDLHDLFEDCNADYPAWSPDGQSFLFLSDRTGNYEVFSASKDGSEITQLTDAKGFDGRARWSPNGSQVVFESDRDGDWEVFIMNKDGSNVRQVTQNKIADWYADWSPDGKWLVYVSMNPEEQAQGADVQKTFEIFIVDTNGQNQTRLTMNNVDDIQPRWVP